jgi:hypothetical protein
LNELWSKIVIKIAIMAQRAPQRCGASAKSSISQATPRVHHCCSGGDRMNWIGLASDAQLDCDQRLVA